MDKKEEHENRVREYYAHLLKNNPAFTKKRLSKLESIENEIRCRFTYDPRVHTSLKRIRISYLNKTITEVLGPDNVYPICIEDYTKSRKEIESLALLKPTHFGQYALEKYLQFIDVLCDIEKVSTNSDFLADICCLNTHLNPQRVCDSDILKINIYLGSNPDIKFKLKFELSPSTLHNLVEDRYSKQGFDVSSEIIDPITSFVKLCEQYTTKNKPFGKPILEGPIGAEFGKIFNG
jgi:hypothetical protein